MSVRLYVGNLPYDVTEAELRTLFSAAVPPSSVRVPVDRETGKPRGFAFVEFAEAAQAAEAARRFNGELFKARPLVVNEARAREESTGSRPAPPAGSRPSETSAPAAPDRQGQPRRTFGPDAPPRGRRKHESRSAKGERAPKGPLKERSGGQFYAGDVDDSPDDDPGADDFALWAREKAEKPDEE